jgi:hypothetical protein
MTYWVKAIFKPPEYGLGLAHEQLAGEDVWGHSGDIFGFHTDLWYLPRSGVTSRRSSTTRPAARARTRTGWPSS